jgi:hypothetical protein
MALNFNLLAQEGPKNLYEGFEQGRQAVAQNALAQQKLAQEGEMMSMRRQEFQANLESSRAERRRKATVEKTAMFRDRILRAPTPQAARELVRMQHSDPDLGPVMQQLGSLDQDLADIPDDPTGFENWRQREAMGAAEFIKSQASERGFQDLLAKVRGGQQGAAVAPAMPSSAPGAMAAPAELAAGTQPEPMASVPGVISTSRVPGVTTAPITASTGTMREIAPGGAMGAEMPFTRGAPVNALAPAPASTNAMAAPAGIGRTPAQIRAEIDQLSMSNDPRAARMVQTLTKEYEAALRGGQNRTTLSDRFVPVGKLVFDRQDEKFISPPQGTFEERPTTAARVAAPSASAAQGKPMTALQQQAFRKGMAADKTNVKASQSVVNELEKLTDELVGNPEKKIAPHPGLSGITGIQAMLPSLPESLVTSGNARKAQQRLETLKGKVMAFGRQLASLEGKLGNMAVQEWKFVSDSIQAIDPAAGNLDVQLRDIVRQAKNFANTVQERYDLTYEADGAPAEPTATPPRAGGNAPTSGGLSPAEQAELDQLRKRFRK